MFFFSFLAPVLHAFFGVVYLMCGNAWTAGWRVGFVDVDTGGRLGEEGRR